MDRVGAGHQGHVAARPLVRLVNIVIVIVIVRESDIIIYILLVLVL